MADYLYPDPASMDYFGQYLTPEIYPWLGQGNTGKVNRSAFSPLLFPPERPVTSPIVPQEELTPQTFGGGVVLDTEPYVSKSDKTRQAIEQRIEDAPMAIEPYISDRDRRIQAIDQRIANSPIPIEPYVSPKMADTQTNTSFMDNLGGLLFGGTGDGMEGYLSEKQQKAMQNQAMMQAAASLLKSSGRTTQPISIGQALGEAYGAGTAGYQQAQQGAIQQLITKQKLDEMKRAQAQQQAYQNFLTGQPTAGTEITPQQALSVPGMQVGPTVERAAMIGQPMPSDGTATGGASVLTPMQRAMLSQLSADKGIPEMLKLTQPTEKAKLLAELGMKPTLENLRLLEKPEADPEKIKYLKALNMPITLENLRQLDKPEALPHEIQLLKATNMPITFENVQAIRKSAAANVTVDTGQKGFENKMTAKKTFMSEPIYKDFNDMKSAYGQVLTALDQGSPIGDVAGATKVMKLLDPGSVVRESELGIAMAASGRMDRLKFYFNNWATGEKLTPTQREDFKALSNELYAAAGQAYNQKRGEYIDFGNSTGVTLDKALGEPAKLPSIVKKQKVGRLVTDPKTGVTRYVEE
jgi:hypothetical protein